MARGHWRIAGAVIAVFAVMAVGVAPVAAKNNGGNGANGLNIPAGATAQERAVMLACANGKEASTYSKCGNALDALRSEGPIKVLQGLANVLSGATGQQVVQCENAVDQALGTQGSQPVDGCGNALPQGLAQQLESCLSQALSGTGTIQTTTVTSPTNTGTVTTTGTPLVNGTPNLAGTPVVNTANVNAQQGNNGQQGANGGNGYAQVADSQDRVAGNPVRTAGNPNLTGNPNLQNQGGVAGVVTHASPLYNLLQAAGYPMTKLDLSSFLPSATTTPALTSTSETVNVADANDVTGNPVKTAGNPNLVQPNTTTSPAATTPTSTGSTTGSVVLFQYNSVNNLWIGVWDYMLDAQHGFTTTATNNGQGNGNGKGNGNGNGTGKAAGTPVLVSDAQDIPTVSANGQATTAATTSTGTTQTTTPTGTTQTTTPVTSTATAGCQIPGILSGHAAYYGNFAADYMLDAGAYDPGRNQDRQYVQLYTGATPQGGNGNGNGNITGNVTGNPVKLNVAGNPVAT